jgi:uncharacterized protein (TIGR02117 family)
MTILMFFNIKRNLSIIVILALGLLFFSPCHGNNTGYEVNTSYEVFVIQNFWHTGIVFHPKDVDPDIWPEIQRYQRFNFVDTGWGDEKFYQAEGNPFFLGARAMLWPTSSVLQVVAFNTRLRAAYGINSRILRIPVDREQLDDLSRFVAESYLRDKNGFPITSTAYGETNIFFLATRKYHLFRTCNTWVAKAFRQAGFDVRSFGVLNANQLYRQLTGIPGAEFQD